MKKALFALLFISLAVGIFAVPVKDFLIFNNFNNSFKIAKALDKGLIIVFSSPTCYYCEMLKNDVFSDEKISNLLTNNFIVAEMYADPKLNGNFDTNIGKFSDDSEQFTYDELFAIFGVRGTPHTAFFSRTLEYAGSIPGMIPSEIFGGLIKYISQELYSNDIEFDKYDSVSDKFEGFKTIKSITEEQQSLITHYLPEMITEYDFESFKNENLTMLDPYKYYIISGTTLDNLKTYISKLDKSLLYNLYVIE